MIEHIGELITNKIMLDFYNNALLTVFIMIVIYLLSSAILIYSLLVNKHTFRINSEGIYSVIKIITETIYIFSVALSILLIILLLTINNTIAGVLKVNWFSIVGLIVLSFVSLPYRIIFTERSNLLNFVDYFIITASAVFTFIGIIFDSLSYFEYIIN